MEKHTPRAGCAGYAEGFSTERHTLTDHSHGLTKKAELNETHENLKDADIGRNHPEKDFADHELGRFTEPFS
jgi:hypothetical protein